MITIKGEILIFGIANTFVYTYAHHLRNSLSLQPTKNAEKISHYNVVFSANHLIDYFEKKIFDEKEDSEEKSKLKKTNKTL